MEGNVALISIHPEYADMIVSGEKKLEFRRSWAATHVDFIVIYATAPVKRIVAVSKIGKVFQESRTGLWDLARERGGGITRRKLFAYLEGKKQAFALELVKTLNIKHGICPKDLFGNDFRPPQSFRYLSQNEVDLLIRQLGG